MDVNAITGAIIGCSFAVGNTLVCGFLEKVYENALIHDLRKAGLEVHSQHPIDVFYDGVIVGQYIADLVVERCVIVELKTVKAFDDVHLAQCLNYLKATGFKMCLLINFGAPRVEVKRVVSNFG